MNNLLFGYVSEKGIRSLKDLQYLKEDSDYEEIGLTRFEKYKLKDVIASLHVLEQGNSELRGTTVQYLNYVRSVLLLMSLCVADPSQHTAGVVDNNGKGSKMKTVKSNETPGNYDRVHDLGHGTNVVVLSLGDDWRTVPAVNNNGGSPESKRDTSGVCVHCVCLLQHNIIFYSKNYF